MNSTDKSNISRARFILKHAPEIAKLVRDGHPNHPLSKTYDAVKSEVAEHAENEIRKDFTPLERVAIGKAAEAVRHATNCGLMLLQVKASLNHGEWLPWLNGEIESGRLEVKSTQARVYMRVASNKQRGVYLEETPSIRAALELLSDKDPEEQQGTLIDVEAERQAREAAEAKAETERQSRELFERRAQEIQTESNERRKKIRELETQIDLLKAQPAPKPEKVIVAPDDYETAKGKVAQLETELANLKKEQAKLISNQVKAKLHERQDELDVMERRKTLLEEQVARMTAYMASLDSEVAG